jgi:hypothetical protein
MVYGCEVDSVLHFFSLVPLEYHNIVAFVMCKAVSLVVSTVREIGHAANYVEGFWKNLQYRQSLHANTTDVLRFP